MATYFEKLKDPRWQRRRLEVMQRDGFTCVRCHSTQKTLTVHHVNYERGAEPWEHLDADLQTMCTDCHAEVESFIPRFRRMIADLPAWALQCFLEIGGCLASEGEEHNRHFYDFGRWVAYLAEEAMRETPENPQVGAALDELAAATWALVEKREAGKQ